MPQSVAQTIDLVSRSYVTPFPAGDLYKLYVFGDTLGDGIANGLETALHADGRIEVVRKSRPGSGFARSKSSGLKAVVEKTLKTETIHIIVVMLGINERQTIKVKRKRYAIGTPKWRAAYGARIDAFLDVLKKARVAVYWVGLPVMRSPSVNEKMQALNDIYRERTFLKGVKFVDTWNRFVDNFGRYSAYGPDVAGQVRRLRAKDGVHFTKSGYSKLAHFVEREIRRDLAAAKAERNLPLAGGKEEQARAIRSATAEAKRSTGGAKNKGRKYNSAALKAKKRNRWGTVVAQTVPKGSKGEKLSVKIIDDIRIVRPRIPEIALATALSRSNSANFAGEMLANDIEGGLTALASVSPSNDLSLKTAKQRVPLTQLPYYKVLIKGEKMTPKAGRADDFSWPRAQLSQ
ncbi:MAG: SGNH/GDSL hydrolase family protein [Methyloligellaceae bacterium]